MCLSGFNFRFCTHYYTSTTCQISFTYSADTIYITTCREIRSFDISHQFLYCDFLIINICFTSINYFRKIMRRHISCHTYRNTGSTINQKIRNTGRHHLRLCQRIIKVRFEVYSFLIQVIHHRFTQLV